MEKKSNVLNINNIDKLKVIFSYLDFQYILKLIKYNKKIQNELGIKLENYKNNLNNPKYIIQREIDDEDRVSNKVNLEIPLMMKALTFILNYGMFFNCTSLTSLNLSNFNTNNVNNMCDVFTGLNKNCEIETNDNEIKKILLSF